MCRLNRRHFLSNCKVRKKIPNGNEKPRHFPCRGHQCFAAGSKSVSRTIGGPGDGRNRKLHLTDCVSARLR